MKSLDARIEELERRQPSSEPVTIVLRPLVAAGEPEHPIKRLRDSQTSETWDRNPDEGEDAFIGRVAAELRRRDGPTACATLVTVD